MHVSWPKCKPLGQVTRNCKAMCKCTPTPLHSSASCSTETSFISPRKSVILIIWKRVFSRSKHPKSLFCLVLKKELVLHRTQWLSTYLYFCRWDLMWYIVRPSVAMSFKMPFGVALSGPLSLWTALANSRCSSWVHLSLAGLLLVPSAFGQESSSRQLLSSSTSLPIPAPARHNQRCRYSRNIA